MSDVHREAVQRHLQTVLGAGAVGDLSDGSLLERFLAGRGDSASSAAFAALVERHGPMVWRVCRDVLRDPNDAEDASQATFLVLARRAGSIRRADSLASWLFGVALRVAAKSRAGAVRRRDRERRGAEMRAQSGVGSGRDGAWSELYEEVGRLPERHRGPVVLCHLEGLTQEQAAARLGLPVRTVQRRLAEAMERMRTRLIRRGLAPAVGPLGMGLVAEATPAMWAEATVRAASGIAAGGATASVASASVAGLTEGVVATMTLARWKAIATGFLALGAASVALVAFGGSPNPAERPARLVSAKADEAKIAPSGLGPRVEGIVVDEAGRPVAGASVALLWTIRPRPTTTAADGTFTLDTDEPRRANLAFLATADGGARQGIFRFSDLSGNKDPRTPLRIVLKPAREVKVTAVDGRGLPVAGAKAFILDVVFPVAEGTTDERGVATLRIPAEAMTQWVFGSKPGVGLDYFETYRSIPATYALPPAEVRLVLDGARTVRVKVVDSVDKPVPGVELVPWLLRKAGKLGDLNLSGGLIHVRTDDRGIATFDWLPADLDLRGQMTFLLQSWSYAMPRSPRYQADAPSNDLVARVLRLTKVSGKVTRPDGAPAAGVLVQAAGTGDVDSFAAGAGRARTAPDGSYTMDLAPEQSYMIVIVDDEWAAPTRAGVVVREGKAQDGIDFALSKGAIIRGRVTAGAASAPAVGEALSLNEQGALVPAGTIAGQRSALVESFMHVVDTDGDGRYAFRVGPGGYGLLGPREPGVPRQSEERLGVVEGQVIEKDYHLRRVVRLGRTIRGIVRARTPDGPPIAGAVVVEEPIGVRIPPTRGVADDRGRFELPHYVEMALIYARNPQGDLAGYVTAGEDREEVTIVAGPAASARGRVVDSTGKPRAGVTVSYRILISPEGAEPPMGAGQSTVTDEDGRFSAGGLLPGTRCRLFASNPEGGNSGDRAFDVDRPAPIDLGAMVLDPRPGR